MREESRSLKRRESERSSLDFRIWAWTCLRCLRLVEEERAVKRVVGVVRFVGLGFGW